jgi:hypothetical protein
VTTGVLRPDRYRVDRDIFPIFAVTLPEAGQRLISFHGTGFLIGKQVFVSCWHCLDKSLPADQFYAALVRINGGYRAVALIEPERDRNGTDLATAKVTLNPEFGLTLAHRMLRTSLTCGRSGTLSQALPRRSLRSEDKP